MTIEHEYRERYGNVLKPLAKGLMEYIEETLEGGARIDRVAARAKSVDRFVAKAANTNADGELKYEKPLAQIQDQIGARVTVFYKSDVERVSKLLLEYLRPIETKDLVPVSEWQFGYFGRHFVCHFPTELIDDAWEPDQVPQFFELQIKTLFQHAWSEANHDLGYKPDGGKLDSDQVRMLAFTSAQAWGADRAFDDLFVQLHERAGEHE